MGRAYPPLRPYASGDVWAMTASEAAAFDRHAIEARGVPQPVLMENAGRAAAAVLDRVFPGGPVLAVAGAGNNGGDALVAARSLLAWGREVRVLLVADRATDDPLLHGWPVDVLLDDGLDDPAWDTLARGAACILDGVLGTGVRGAPRERQARAIERINRADAPVLALDVPSGIDAGTGAAPGAAVRAEVTVSFGAPKLGALLHPARDLVGRHVVAEIGFPPVAAADATARVTTPRWARAHRPVRSTDTHKNEVGRVLVVGGSEGMGGAAILAARAAFRAGVGLVRVASVQANRAALHAALPEAIFVDRNDADALAAAVAASDAVGIGPGLGTSGESEAALRCTLETGDAALVVDADGLNLVASGVVDLAAAARARAVLLTPHPGEMARLMGEAPPDRIPLARACAERFGCAVLLKGAPSLVVAADGSAAVDTQSSSDLAVAGMGDVLTGVCAALVAQGLEPAVAGSVGLYLSGRAGRIAGRGAALTPSDVVGWLPQALTEEGRAESDLGLPFVLFDDDPAR